MIYFYEIDTKTDDYEERMQVVQTLIFNIEKVSAITSLDNCYLDVHSYLSSSIDNISSSNSTSKSFTSSKYLSLYSIIFIY